MQDSGFNPDLKEEMGKGTLMAALNLLGIFLAVIGGAVIAYTKIFGLVTWILGLALLFITLAKNLQTNQGKGFRTANIVMKIILIVLFLALGLIMLINK